VTFLYIFSQARAETRPFEALTDFDVEFYSGVVFLIFSVMDRV